MTREDQLCACRECGLVIVSPASGKPAPLLCPDCGQVLRTWLVTDVLSVAGIAAGLGLLVAVASLGG